MTRSALRRFVWPVLGGIALASTAAGSRVSLSVPILGLLGVLLTVLGVGVLVALPGLASLALASRKPLSAASRLGVLLSGSGIAAFAEFWAWVASPTLGRVLAAALLVGSLGVVAIARPTVLLDDPQLRAPIGICLLVAVGYVGLAYSQGGLGGYRWTSGLTAGDTTLAMSYRYWLAPDNTLPLLFAHRLASHGPLTVPILAEWHTSDRPPLQTGFSLMVYPLIGRTSFAYQLLGTVLQAIWIPSLWILLRSRRIDVGRVLTVVIVTAATGTIFANTIYVWPKMLAGAFTLAAFAVVLEDGSLTLAAVLGALALLSHGGAIFSLLALLPLFWRLRRSKAQVSLAAVAAAALYVPWMVYQHFLDPPGDRLLKWQIAGVIRIDRNSFLDDLLRQYFHNPVHSFVLNKLVNVESLAVVPTIWTKAHPTWTSLLAAARSAELTSILPALGPLLLGLVGLASPTVRRSLRPVAPLFWIAGVSVVCWVILEYGGSTSTTVIHQGPYALLVLGVALAALTTSYLPRWLAATILGASVAWFCVAWLPGLGFQAVQPGIEVTTDWPMIGLALASVAVLGSIMIRVQRRAELHRTVTGPRANPPPLTDFSA